MTWGIVYVVRNARLGENVVKVGKTSRSIDERLRELNSPTSNLGSFEPLAYFVVSDIDRVEFECHAALTRHRIQSNREFFSGDLDEIVSTVERVANNFPPNPFRAREISRKVLDVRPQSIEGIAPRLMRLKSAAVEEARIVNEREAAALATLTGWSKEIRALLSKVLDNFVNEPRVKLWVPLSEPRLLSADGHSDDGLEKKLAEMRTEISPIAEARLFANEHEQGILVQNGDGLASRVIDDGRLLDFSIIAQKLTSSQKEELEECGVLSRADGEVCMRIIVYGFEYTKLGALYTHELPSEKREYEEPDYHYSGIGLSRPFFETRAAVDCFLNALAESLSIPCLKARLIEMDESWQRVTPLNRPSLLSLRWW